MKLTNKVTLLLSIFLVLLLGFFLAMTLTGDSVRAIKGAQQVVYPIYLNNTEAIAGFQVEINYSTNYLTLANVQTTSRTSNATVVYNDEAPIVKLAVLVNNGSEEISPGDGAALNLIFNVDPDAVVGKYAINMNDLIAVNISTIPLNVSNVSGNFEIVNPYNVTFLPPISNFENFTLQNGATLPFKFNVTDGNGFVTDDSVFVRIYNESLGVNYTFNSSDITISPTDGFYHVNIDTNKLGMSEGLYNIDVSFDNYQTESIDFELVDKANGIGRGRIK